MTNEEQDMSTVVAIDGPAGSGKSSVSKAAARELGFDYQDTGAAYRAFALSCLDRRVDLEDVAAIVDAIQGFDYGVDTDPAGPVFRLGSRDVTAEIREPHVTAAVAAIAKVPAVRQWMVEFFRRTIGASDRGGIVTEGRDITTVVAPDADVRILLTADEAVRISRRAAELTGVDAAGAGDALKRRDASDAKNVDFMSAADGVTTLDSTNLDFDETVAAVVALVRGAQ
jgi:CMP/dCMP kinase